MTHRAEVDHRLCTGYAECARMAPAAFRINDDNQSEPRESPGGVSNELLLAAAQECPTNAIRLIDDDGTIVYESA